MRTTGSGRRATHPGPPPVPLVEGPYRRAMASGMVVGGVTSGLSRLVALAVTPLLVVVLGLSLYGFWAIAMVLVGSQSLIDLGLGTALVRYSAEVAAHRDRQSLRRLVRLGLVGYAIVSAVFAAAVLPLAHLLPQWLGVPPASRPAATLLVYGVTVLFALSNALVVFTGALQGLQRLDVVGWATLAGQCAYAGGVALTWARGWGIWGLLAAQCLLYAVPLCWLSRLLATQLRGWSPIPEPGAEEGPSLPTLLSFGGRAQIVAGVDAALAQLPRLVAAALLGSAAAGRVDLALRIPTAVMGAPSQALLQPLLPAFTRLRRSPGSALALLARALRLLAAVLGPLTLALAAAGPTLVVWWVGNPGMGLASPLRWAAVGTLGYGFAGLANSAALGSGRAALAVRWRFLLLGISLVSYPTMAWAWGLSGLIAAFALTSCGVAGLALTQLIRRLGKGARPTARAALAPVAWALALAAVVAGLSFLPRVSPWEWWVLPIGAGTLTYILVALPLGVVKSDEAVLMGNLLHGRRPRPGPVHPHSGRGGEHDAALPHHHIENDAAGDPARAGETTCASAT